MKVFLLYQKFNFSWAESKIELVKGYKYLGVFLDEHLTFDIHCQAITKSADRALAGIVSKVSYFKNIAFKTLQINYLRLLLNPFYPMEFHAWV